MSSSPPFHPKKKTPITDQTYGTEEVPMHVKKVMKAPRTINNRRWNNHASRSICVHVCMLPKVAGQDETQAYSKSSTSIPVCLLDIKLFFLLVVHPAHPVSALIFHHINRDKSSGHKTTTQAVTLCEVDSSSTMPCHDARL